MPTLQENIDLPGQVNPEDVTIDVHLWGNGQAIAATETATGNLVGGPRRTSADATGLWSIPNLPGSTAISQPAGTVWRVERSWPGLDEPLITYCSLPTTGGPYTPKSIEATAPQDLPLQASNELQYVKITTDTSALTVPNFLSVTAVPNLLFTVPDLARPILLRGQLQLTASLTGVGIYTAYGPVGATLGDVFGPDWVPSVGTAGSSRITSAPRHRFDPHTPSTVQLYVGTDTFSSVNITVRSALQSLSWVGAESR